ncbi:hypothetical protein BT69DRAFT_1350917 [Atractiella rhizophila]|nr:hypothetical protein BT69DRAFT_1350917 [Atractiella rhizophila]
MVQGTSSSPSHPQPNRKSVGLYLLASALLVIAFAIPIFVLVSKSYDDFNEQEKKVDKARRFIPSLRIAAGDITATMALIVVGAGVAVALAVLELILLVWYSFSGVNSHKSSLRRCGSGLRSSAHVIWPIFFLAAVVSNTVIVANRSARVLADDDVTQWFIDQILEAADVKTAYKDFPLVVDTVILSWFAWFFVTSMALFALLAKRNRTYGTQL